MKRDLAKVRPPETSSTAQSIATILILIHFFCVLLALSGNVMRSVLQDRLIGILHPYLQLLNFDPDFAAFHLTRGTAEDVDHRWEVLPVGKSATDPDAWQAIPNDLSPWGESAKHWQRMSKLAAMQAEENEPVAAELARGAARFALHQLKIKPQQIRCRRVHDRQTWNNGPQGLSEFPYVATVLVADNGRVEVARISELRETALPENTPGDTP